MKEYWKNGIMGMVIGDALCCPIQFMPREEVSKDVIIGKKAQEAKPLMDALAKEAESESAVPRR